jgi:glutamyl-tRNA reductase
MEMRVGIIGLNHKLAALGLRETLAKVCQRRFGPETSTHGDHAFILLSTCNRTEIYFSSQDLPNTHSYILSVLRSEVFEEFDQKIYSYFGNDCFLHLNRVVSGLDSAIIAETEIQGQVKAAYEIACQYNLLPNDLHYIFQKALHVGKKVRSSFPLSRGLPDLEHAVFNTGLHFFKKPQDVAILFIGASDINHKVLHYFKNKGLTNLSLCNRSEETALPLVTKLGLKFLPWKALSSWQAFDWVICGTKSPQFLITTPREFPAQPKLMIDLSVPRNIDPQLGRHSSMTLLNIDQLNRMLEIRKRKIQTLLNSAEEFVALSTKKYSSSFFQKQLQREHILAIGA